MGCARESGLLVSQKNCGISDLVESYSDGLSERISGLLVSSEKLWYFGLS